MALKVGTKAPHFTLKSLTNDGLVDVALAEHIGEKPVVLLFVPAAFTGVCTEELCDVTGGVHALPNAKVFAISVDSPFAQQAWAKSANIEVQLLSDYAHKVVAQYDVVLDDLAGLGPSSKRAAFVIDTDGVIVHSEETATPKDLPNMEAIFNLLNA
jgi:glutaredoxin-dependent peroxiredoxin